MTLKPFKLLAALVGVGLVAAILMLWFSTTSPRARVAPNPNGEADFIRAGQLVVVFPGAAMPTNRSDLQSYLASNTEPLRLIREGLAKECQTSWGSGTNRIQQHVDELARLKQLARLLGAQARLAELDGRINEAARLHLETIRFGNEAVRGGMVLDKLVGVAMEHQGTMALEKLVPGLDAPSRAAIARELRQIDARRETPADILRQEGEWRRANTGRYQRLIFSIPIPALNPVRKIEQNLISKMNQQKAREDQLLKLLTD